jgi:hypothetical protein
VIDPELLDDKPAAIADELESLSVPSIDSGFTLRTDALAHPLVA